MTDMTKGSPLALVSKFTIPLLLGNILQQMYNVVDSIVVGNFVGPDALAAVGNSFIITFLMFALFAGIGQGATILISQFMGAKNYRDIQKTVDTMYITLFVGGILVCVIGIVLAPIFLKILNTPDGNIMDMSTIYLQTIFAGTLATFGYSVNNGILQGIGDGKSSLLFLGIATILNIVLDLLFVVVFKLGIFGVALATIIAQTFAFIFGIFYINKTIHIFKIRFRHMNYEWRLLKKSLQIGIPAAIQNMLMSLGIIAIQRLVNSFGATFMAGYSAASKIDSFVFMPIMSFGTAITTFVGQNTGANKFDRVKSGVKATLALSIGLSLIISTACVLFGSLLLRAFTNDEGVIFVGQQYINRIMPCFPILTVLFVLSAAIRGAGQTIIPLLITIMSFLGARVPSAYILTHLFGEYSMFWCFGIGWLIGILAVIPYYLSGHWKKSRITIDKT